MEKLIQLDRVSAGLFSNSFSYIANPYKYFEKGLKLYGPNFAVPYIGGKRANLFSESCYVEEIFKADPEVLLSGEANKLLGNILGKNSVIVLDGDNHKNERKLLTPPFNGERMRLYDKVIEESVLEIFREKIKTQNEIILFDVIEDTTIDIILKTIFGAKKEDHLGRLHTLHKELKTMANPITSMALFFPAFQINLGGLTPYARYTRLRKEADALIDDLIDKKKNSKDQDILSVMLTEKYEDGKEQNALSVRNQLLTLLVAGQDTTNHSLAWVFTWLLNSQAKYKILLKKMNDYASVEDAAKDEYLDAVIKEAMRIYPVFSTVNRIAAKDFVIGEKYLIPKGEYVTAFTYGAHHNQEVYPNSFEFRPERFLERKFTQYEYFPFGGGRRKCIGQAFSINQMKITVATILKNFKLEVLEVCKPIPYRKGIGMRPKGEIKLRVLKHPML